MPTPIPKVASSSISPSDALYNQASFTLDAVASLNAALGLWLAVVGIIITAATFIAGAIGIGFFNWKLKQAETQYGDILAKRLEDAEKEFSRKNQDLREQFARQQDALLEAAAEHLNSIQLQQEGFSENLSALYHAFDAEWSERFASLEATQQERIHSIVDALSSKGEELQKKLDTINEAIESSRKKRDSVDKATSTKTSLLEMLARPAEPTQKDVGSGPDSMIFPQSSFQEFIKRTTSSSIKAAATDEDPAMTVNSYLKYLAQKNNGDA